MFPSEEILFDHWFSKGDPQISNISITGELVKEHSLSNPIPDLLNPGSGGKVQQFVL